MPIGMDTTQTKTNEHSEMIMLYGRRSPMISLTGRLHCSEMPRSPFSRSENHRQYCTTAGLSRP